MKVYRITSANFLDGVTPRNEVLVGREGVLTYLPLVGSPLHLAYTTEGLVGKVLSTSRIVCFKELNGDYCITTKNTIYKFECVSEQEDSVDED